MTPVQRYGLHHLPVALLVLALVALAALVGPHWGGAAAAFLFYAGQGFKDFAYFETGPEYKEILPYVKIALDPNQGKEFWDLLTPTLAAVVVATVIEVAL